MAIKHWDWADKFGYSEDVFAKLKKDYTKLFDVLLRNVVNSLDGGRYYVRSSPISFWEEDADHIANHHYWGVWHGEEPFSEYQKRVPRFMTEYGFQSFPLKESIEKFTLVEDQALSSPVMTVHQKHPRGNGLIAAYMDGVYPKARTFEHLVYLSQVQQAEGLKLAFDAHRRAKPYCMGTLYWQLNDTWPSASWTGIDYYGKWKALHYQAKRSFAPISLTIEELEPDEFSIYLLNDTLTTQRGECAINVKTLDGLLLYSSVVKVTAPANENGPIVDMALNRKLSTIKRDNAYIETVFRAEDGQTTACNHFFLAPPVAQTLARPDVDINVQTQGQRLDITLTAKSVVRQLYVELEGSNAQFDDNFIDLLPGEPKTLTAFLDENSARDANNLGSSLSLLSLNDCMEDLCS
jgi:beta-mannosidase